MDQKTKQTMKTVGLTGGMGSGKSFVASIFSSFGVPVYCSDIEAKKLMTSSTSVIKGVKSIFGPQAYLETGELNKKLISTQIFTDKDKLERINNVVHPAVRKDFEIWANKHSDAPYVINEAALFIENGTYQNFDFLISVLSPLKLRIQRIEDRDHINQAEILLRISNQSSDEEKIDKSDFLIYNDNGETLLSQITQIHQLISKH